MNDVRGRGRGRRGQARIGRLTNEDRRRLISAFQNGDDYQYLAQQMNINYSTARSVIGVWLREGRVERIAEGGARRIVVTEEISNALFDIAISEPFTTLESIRLKLLAQFPLVPVSTSTIARHLDGQLITTKIAGKDADVPAARNRPQTIEERFHYSTWLSSLGINDNLVYIDETGYNLFTRRTKGRALRGERVRRQTLPRGPNVNLIMATAATIGLVHHTLGMFTLTHVIFQEFINELCEIIHDVFPANEFIHIVYDGARPQLGTAIPPNFQGRISLHRLPPYSPFYNPVEQANSCFKQTIKQAIITADVQRELRDEDARLAAGMNIGQYRGNILIRLGRNALGDITQHKCQNWAARVNRYIPASRSREPIVD